MKELISTVVSNEILWFVSFIGLIFVWHAFGLVLSLIRRFLEWKPISRADIHLFLMELIILFVAVFFLLDMFFNPTLNQKYNPFLLLFVLIICGLISMWAYVLFRKHVTKH